MLSTDLPPQLNERAVCTILATMKYEPCSWEEGSIYHASPSGRTRWHPRSIEMARTDVNDGRSRQQIPVQQHTAGAVRDRPLSDATIRLYLGVQLSAAKHVGTRRVRTHYDAPDRIRLSRHTGLHRPEWLSGGWVAAQCDVHATGGDRHAVPDRKRRYRAPNYRRCCLRDRGQFGRILVARDGALRRRVVVLQTANVVGTLPVAGGHLSAVVHQQQPVGARGVTHIIGRQMYRSVRASTTVGVLRLLPVTLGRALFDTNPNEPGGLLFYK